MDGAQCYLSITRQVLISLLIIERNNINVFPVDGRSSCWDLIFLYMTIVDRSFIGKFHLFAIWVKRY